MRNALVLLTFVLTSVGLAAAEQPVGAGKSGPTAVVETAPTVATNTTADLTPLTVSAPDTNKCPLAEWFWPLGFYLPESLGGINPAQTAGKPPRKGDILIWVPEGAKRIRAVLLIPNNSDSIAFGAHRALREVATKREMGIIYMRKYDPGIEHCKTVTETNRIERLLEVVADFTGISEFRYAPWITFGKSSRGEFPFRAAWLRPERTIACISYHGETPTWPVAEWAQLNGQTIFQVNANGETEWGGTWFNHVRPCLLNYRARESWLAHQVVAKGVGHGDYPESTSGKGDSAERMSRLRIWDYLALFVDKAIDLRVPKDRYPTTGPVELKQVDETTGYLIDPFAVEKLYRVPLLPLREKGGAYTPNNDADVAADGFLALSPLKEFKPAEGVPVVKVEPGKSPRQWLVTKSLKFTMKADPILELGDLAKLMPKPGDEVNIDGKVVTFDPILPDQVGRNGGIALKSGKNTLLAYTVIDVPERRCLRVQAAYTAATRVQMVINGVPVRHKQVLEFQPGLYPMLIVLRMGIHWDRIEPCLGGVSDEDVALAKKMQAETDLRGVEDAQLASADPRTQKALIRKASGVSKDERKRMFWVADAEQAEAWFKLHAVHGQKFEVGQ